MSTLKVNTVVEQTLNNGVLIEGVRVKDATLGIGTDNPNYALDVRGFIQLRLDALATVAPELHFVAMNGTWFTGIDVANHGGARDYVLAGRLNADGTSVNDIIYLNYGTGFDPVAIGLGWTPPDDNSYRVWVSSDDVATTMGGLVVRRGSAQTGHLLAVRDSNGIEKWWLNKDYDLTGVGGLGVKADVSDNGLAIKRSTGAQYGFNFSGNALVLRYATGGVNVFQANTDGGLGVVVRLGVGMGSPGPEALDIAGNLIRLRTAKTPATAVDTGNAGDICWDAGFVYVCVAANTWKRSALTTW